MDFLVDYIADEILSRLELNRCNLLNSGGGYFRLLLPNTSNVRKELHNFENEVKTYLMDTYNTDINYLHFCKPCSANTFKNTNNDLEKLIKNSNNAVDGCKTGSCQRKTKCSLICI